MARKSQSKSVASTPRGSVKRARIEEQTLSAAAKRPKRQSSAANLKSTPTKSKYFEPDSDEDEQESESSAGEEGSGYEDNEGSRAASPVSSGDEVESALSEGEEKPKKWARGRPSTGNPTKVSNGSSGKKELWKEGVKAGLGPGTQVVIKKPKARPAGDTPYSEETIHPNTMLFLKDLKANNNRQWLKSRFTFHIWLPFEHIPFFRADDEAQYEEPGSLTIFDSA